MCTYTLETMPLKKKYAGNMDSTLTPKIYCSIKHTQHIIPDAIYIASVPGENVWLPHEKQTLEAAKITLFYQKDCCPSAVHS